MDYFWFGIALGLMVGMAMGYSLRVMEERDKKKCKCSEGCHEKGFGEHVDEPANSGE